MARREWTELRERLAADGIEIDPDTAATRWRGERMDYELGVWVLCAQAERARQKPSDPTDPLGRRFRGNFEAPGGRTWAG